MSHLRLRRSATQPCARFECGEYDTKGGHSNARQQERTSGQGQRVADLGGWPVRGDRPSRRSLRPSKRRSSWSLSLASGWRSSLSSRCRTRWRVPSGCRGCRRSRRSPRARRLPSRNHPLPDDLNISVRDRECAKAVVLADQRDAHVAAGRIEQAVNRISRKAVIQIAGPRGSLW